MHRILWSVLMSIATAAVIAGGPITWRFLPAQAPDGAVQVKLDALCGEGWHIYALTLPRDDGPIPTSIHVTPGKAFELSGDVQEPSPTEVDDPNFQMKLRYHSGETEFTVPIKRLTKDAFIIEGEVEFMACNDKTCLPPQVVKFSVPFPAAP